MFNISDQLVKLCKCIEIQLSAYWYCLSFIWYGCKLAVIEYCRIYVHLVWLLHCSFIKIGVRILLCSWFPCFFYNWSNIIVILVGVFRLNDNWFLGSWLANGWLFGFLDTTFNYIATSTKLEWFWHDAVLSCLKCKLSQLHFFLFYIINWNDLSNG